MKSSGPTGYNRAAFLRMLGAGAIAAPGLHLQAAAADAPLLRIGVLTDCQYADIPTPAGSKRQYRLSRQKLIEAIGHLNSMGDLDFMMHLGDAIDRDASSFDVVMPLFRQAKVPVYHVAGNHDYSIADGLKPDVPRLLGMESPYYSFERAGWRFVMLDGNALSLFSTAKGSPEWTAAEAFRKTSQTKLADYNGGLGSVQIEWLRGQLKAAASAGQRVVLACHYPLLPLDGHSLWDAGAVLELVQEFKGCIAAWWNGHNHDGNYCGAHGIHFLNFRGMVDTQQNSYARVEIFADRIEVWGYGREVRRTLPFPAPDQEAESLAAKRKAAAPRVIIPKP